ncbi:hypothetical protein OUY22_08965 [Nonomuraea sp. MCN248]|uniref:Extradiol ring-cleavage dioxygenase class III enzyme subunit B domain-containing protein n=1 Tax=Nonomuraea corallina TaxID=2989783 RepID=A0ABT4S8J3_9ACTN|nr:hypothetical protein [Nonomuraea corallina]MDA0633547.1 hypothetical protein [Nonomuraea corallina]
MIVAAATVPGAPLLLPGVTGGPVREAERAREAMAAAVTALLGQGAEEIVVVGGASATRPFPADASGPESRLAPTPPARPRRPEESAAPGSRAADRARAAAPGSRRVGADDVLPVSLAVGRSLLAGCPVPWTLQGVGGDEPRDRCLELGRELGAGERPVGLLVVADGSARRGEKAPGYVDPYAIDLDARIGAALAAADPGALLTLDPAGCERAMVAGRAAWQVMAAACADGTWRSRVLYEEDPFGVAYWVVTWT